VNSLQTGFHLVKSAAGWDLLRVFRTRARGKGNVRLDEGPAFSFILFRSFRNQRLFGQNSCWPRGVPLSLSDVSARENVAVAIITMKSQRLGPGAGFRAVAIAMLTDAGGHTERQKGLLV